MNIKQKLKTAGIGLAVSAATTLAKAQPTENKISDKKMNQTELSQSKKEDVLSKRYSFSHQELSTALHQSGISQKTAFKFAETYSKYLDKDYSLSAQELLQAMADAKLSNQQAFELYNNLDRIFELRQEKSMQETRQGDEISTPKARTNKSNKQLTGYDFGSYEMTYSIDQYGNLNLDFKSDGKDISQADLKEVNEAVCRHTGDAVDDDAWQIKSSQLITQFLVYRTVQEEQKNGKKITNGDVYLKKFENILKKKGLEIGKDNKLHGIEASKNKPLKTMKQLKNEYAQRYQNQLKHRGMD